MLFIEVDGDVIEKELAPGEVLKVDTGNVVAFEPKVSYEVETVKDGVRYVVLSAVNDVYRVLGDNGNTYIYTGRNKLRKTGRHFPEIAAVLEKMKEVHE